MEKKSFTFFDLNLLTAAAQNCKGTCGKGQGEEGPNTVA